MSNATGTLKIWQRFAGAPGGKWAFSKLVCMKAPYFSSIQPLFEEIKPGYCTVRMPKRRAVLYSLGQAIRPLPCATWRSCLAAL